MYVSLQFDAKAAGVRLLSPAEMIPLADERVLDPPRTEGRWYEASRAWQDALSATDVKGY